MPVVQGVLVALAPPEGYEVNFDHPQRRGVTEAYWVAGVGMFFSLLSMAQRLYTKVFFSGGLGVDDAFLVLSWMVSICTIGLCLHMFAKTAGGVHAWEIPLETYKIYMVDVYVAAAIYVLAGSFAKLSLLTFYLRLSPEQWFRWANWATIVVIAGYTTGIFLSLVFACRPVSKSWDPSITDGECVNGASLYIATAVANIVTDVVLFVLPIPLLVRLQVPLLQKIGLAIVFTIGSLTVVTSIIRVTILPEMLTSPDQTWVIAYASVWIIVESNLLIICASLPTVRKFLRHVAPRVIGESGYYSGKSSRMPPSGPGRPADLRTFGSGGGSHGGRRARSEYSKFGAEADDDVHDTYVLTGVGGGSDGDEDKETGGMTRGKGGDRRRDGRREGGNVSAGGSLGGEFGEADEVWHDDDSAKAIVRGNRDIVQTRTVTIQTEIAPRAKS